jgi:hypothetical protein
MELDNRELATILAGLRLYQATGGAPDQLRRLSRPVQVVGDIFSYRLSPDQMAAIADIADSCGELRSLDAAEIDALCERLNNTPPPRVPYDRDPAVRARYGLPPNGEGRALPRFAVFMERQCNETRAVVVEAADGTAAATAALSTDFDEDQLDDWQPLDPFDPFVFKVEERDPDEPLTPTE